MAKRPDDRDQTLPKSQGEKEKPDRPGKGSKPQNEADRRSVGMPDYPLCLILRRPRSGRLEG